MAGEEQQPSSPNRSVQNESEAQNRMFLQAWRIAIQETLKRLQKSKSSAQDVSPPPTPTHPGAMTNESGCGVLPAFSAYNAKVEWHTGSRAFFSQLFPKYGNYCGPNWSSGRDRGSLVWDKPPVDWLDYCCFKHDVGYDSTNQLDLYKADIALLECLLSMPPEPANFVREVYRVSCIAGLKSFLIPYRRMLLRQHKDGVGLTPPKKQS